MTARTDPEPVRAHVNRWQTASEHQYPGPYRAFLHEWCPYLGRHRGGRAFVKHHIKDVDRLLGNPHLHPERHGVYGALARTVLGDVARPVILLNWADSAPAQAARATRRSTHIGGYRRNTVGEADAFRIQEWEHLMF